MARRARMARLREKLAGVVAARFYIEHLDQVDIIGPDGKRERFDRYVARQAVKQQ